MNCALVRRVWKVEWLTEQSWMSCPRAAQVRAARINLTTVLLSLLMLFVAWLSDDPATCWCVCVRD